MASPHAAGVAALIRQRHPSLPQGSVAASIRQTATPLACPTDWPPDDERQCTGSIGNTSFFGKGMVNAEKAAAR
jgi:lantibiotic leader peptide-processing serine protease